MDKGLIVREGVDIFDFESGEVIGKVISGCFLFLFGGCNIVMGMVKNGVYKWGIKVVIRVWNKVVKVEIIKLLFVES